MLRRLGRRAARGQRRTTTIGIITGQQHRFSTMRYPSTAAAAAYGLALLPQITQGWTAATVRKQDAFTSTTRLFQSTVSPPMPERQDVTIEEITQSTTTSKAVAQGTIVSQFEGGLSAILLDDGVNDISVNTGSDTKGLTAPATASLSPTLGIGAPAAMAAPKSTATTVADLQGKSVLFPNGSKGIVVAHRPPVVFVLHKRDSAVAAASGLVQVLEEAATIPVPTSAGEIVDCFGGSDDDDSSSDLCQRRPIFSPIPQLRDIALINHPMLTGVTMMDTLAPIGQGQNMLLIGSNVNEMRGYMMDFLQTQHASAKCFYASTSSESRDSVQQLLKDAGLEKSVQVIAPRGDSTNDASAAAQAVAIASAACTLGEAHAKQEGGNALVIVDTIDLHKHLWDVTTRVLVDVFGADAVVASDLQGGASSEMRAFYSSLIQRAGRYKQSKGGGSVTLLLMTVIPKEGDADDEGETVFQESDFEQSPDKVKDRIQLLVNRKIPLTAKTLRKIDIPIPTQSEGQRRLVIQHVDDLISMSDGQIWFDDRLQSSPPMDPQRSVTRIGIGADTESRADAPAIRKISERIRLDLAQAADSIEGAHQSKASKKQILRKNALQLAMHQLPNSGKPRRLSESCVALLAASQGYLDDHAVDEQGQLMAGTSKGDQLVNNLLNHVLRAAAPSMATVDETFDLTESDRTELVNAIASFFDE